MLNDDKWHKFQLPFCEKQINYWKGWYMRRSSKYSSRIVLRLNYGAPEEFFWQRFLELHVNGEMKEQYRIDEHAYESLSRNRNLKTEEYGQIKFTVLMEFESIKVKR